MDAETAVRPLERKLKILYFQFVQNSKHLLCMALPLQAVDALRERVEAQDLPLVSLTPCIEARRAMRCARAPAACVAIGTASTPKCTSVEHARMPASYLPPTKKHV